MTQYVIYFICSKNKSTRAAGESSFVGFAQQPCAPVDTKAAIAANCTRRRTSHSWTSRTTMEFKAIRRRISSGCHLYAAR